MTSEHGFTASALRACRLSQCLESSHSGSLSTASSRESMRTCMHEPPGCMSRQGHAQVTQALLLFSRAGRLQSISALSAATQRTCSAMRLDQAGSGRGLQSKPVSTALHPL